MKISLGIGLPIYKITGIGDFDPVSDGTDYWRIGNIGGNFVIQYLKDSVWTTIAEN